MSKTDKTRPWRVQFSDVAALRPDHVCQRRRYGNRGAPCDLPDDPLFGGGHALHLGTRTRLCRSPQDVL